MKNPIRVEWQPHSDDDTLGLVTVEYDDGSWQEIGMRTAEEAAHMAADLLGANVIRHHLMGGGRVWIA